MTPLNLEILAYEPTPLGILCLRRREMLSQPGTLVTEVTLNHEFLMSSLHTESERALADVALAMHGGTNLNVLVGGLGLGYTAQAALSSTRVAGVEVVELLPEVIAWLERGLVPLAGELNGDSRLTVIHADVYACLVNSPRVPRDVILIDVDHSPDEPLADGDASFFYTKAGLERAGRHLAPGGVLGVWSYAPSTPFADALHGVFQEVHVERITYFNQHVREEHTDWLYFARHPQR